MSVMKIGAGTINWVGKIGVLVAAVTLTACRSGSNGDYYDNDGYYSGSNRLSITDFGVKDTQNNDSRDHATSLVDYRNNLGDFSLYWKAEFSNDYRATLYVSPTHLAQDGRQIAYDDCGLGYTCGFTGASFCNYSANYRIQCDNEGEVYVGDWISGQAPRDLYLVVRLCDKRSQRCDEDAQEVSFY